MLLTYVFNSIVLLLSTMLSLIILMIVINDITQKKHSLLRNFPLIGRLRWFFESERTKIQQYFIENDINGTPYNREKRSDIYQKSKGEINTTPFGTQLNLYEKESEFLQHSMFPKNVNEVKDLRVTIGSSTKVKPYSASIFNISAMSYGSLSDAAIIALNAGAKMGDFYHNTGEGGVSKHHLQGGDLCFQIGTGYFGAGMTINGKRYFNEKSFLKTVHSSNVKMVEIKLSQGAKPSHGGILPAAKNTKEIAEIRGVEPNQDVMSPPYHTAFRDYESMLAFIFRVRYISQIPVGIKLCLGNELEFKTLVNEMLQRNIYPDFITIDGSEGGTGAAPLVYSNNVGMPLFDALKIINDVLIENGIRDKITLIASGKASTSFDVIKLLAMGADVVNAARAFMFSMGCIQARECNKNTCPVGIATQNRRLIKGLDPSEKKVRVYNYHKAIIHEVRELVAGMGLTKIKDLRPDMIVYRNEEGKLKERS